MRSDAVAPAVQPHTSFYVIGGNVRPDAPCYVVREADDELLHALQQGEFCYVLTARQMGKSSLMLRTAQRLRTTGTAVAILDLTRLGTNPNPEEWYFTLLDRILQELRLDLLDDFETFWEQNRRLTPLARFLDALTGLVLPQVPGNLVILLDEIDAVRSLPFPADEFFAGIRELYTRRAQDPSLHRLTFGLFGVASPSDLISDPRITPFNIGRRIQLSDFTASEASGLAQGLRLSGIVRLEGGRLRVRNRIYAHVFDKAWIASQMPDAELKRQRRAYRRGLFRMGFVASIIIVVISLFAFVTLDTMLQLRQWLHFIRDTTFRARISRQVDRRERGNFADHKDVGGGVKELRLHFGPGYRVYYGMVGDTIVILLGGGDKKSQSRDIARAQNLWSHFQPEVLEEANLRLWSEPETSSEDEVTSEKEEDSDGSQEF